MNRKMKVRIVIPVLILALILIIITAALVPSLTHSSTSTSTSKAPYNGLICCIMITGKDNARIEYARKSVKNFNQQIYANRRLIIVNHHPTERVLNIPSNHTHEIKVPKSQDVTLGDLRNIALQFVPPNACWTTWDDDDIRAPNYLSTLASYKTPNTFVCISSRLEYNTLNGFSWVATKDDGFVLFLADADARIKYLQKDTLEDIEIINDLKAHGYKQIILKNDPRLYIRLVHNNNTSSFVRKDRSYLLRGTNYSERLTTPAEHEFITTIV